MSDKNMEREVTKRKLKDRTARTYAKKRRFHGNKKKTDLPTVNCDSDTLLTSLLVGSDHDDADNDFSQSSTVINENKEVETTEDINIQPGQSVSSSKIEQINTENDKNNHISGYRLIDMSLLAGIFQSLSCPECFSSSFELVEQKSKKKGFSSYLSLICNSCGFSRNFSTSKNCGMKGGCDVNRRIVYTMRSCGVGYNGIQKFATLMNMPPPMTKNNYEKINKLFKNAAKEIAERSMGDAAAELKNNTTDDNNIFDVGVSVDAAWSRRGYASLNGVTTAISIDTGKILDSEPMSKFCNACSVKEDLKKTDPVSYDQWKVSHQCKINHIGSSSSMESQGAKRIFERSIKNHKLRYTEFYGDGDSKSHPAVQSTYNGIQVKKLECIGHVQKRVGNRLRNLKKSCKDIGGKGKLTNDTIDKLQNYYGIAIRENVGDLKAMQTAILASLFHIASSINQNYHSAYCPPGPNSWCLAQRDKSLGTKLYKPGPGLPLNVISKIKPIYKDLSKPELLEKCLHGKTQNQNESFPSMIWNRIPKSTHVGLDTFEFGLYDAISNFNIGRKASLEIYKSLDIDCGFYTVNGCNKLNQQRITKAEYQMKKETKSHRKVKRGRKKRKQDKIEHKEGKTYEAGGF